MNLGIIGLGHAFNKQLGAIKTTNIFKNIEFCDSDPKKTRKYQGIKDYHNLLSEYVLVSTSPNNHFKIIEELIYLNKKTILEKPAVVNLEQLEQLKKIANKNNYYNAFHYAFGLEINFFIKKINKMPNKIYSYISDNYIKNGHINEKQLVLCGSYLDETINPLSALTRIFGYDIKFQTVEKKYYKNDIYDYYSKSKFEINNIPLTIEVEWNNKKSQKYIDLYYDDEIIRLDSMNQKVINLTTKKIIYKGFGNRMTNHYVGVFMHFQENKTNLYESIKLHEELLKGVNYEK